MKYETPSSALVVDVLADDVRAARRTRDAGLRADAVDGLEALHECFFREARGVVVDVVKRRHGCF